MTIEHRRQCRNAMWNWDLIEQQQNDIQNACWAYALRKTAAYYEGTDPIRSGIIRERYRRHLTEEQVIDRLHIGHTTYQKANSDLLSTLAVYAAQIGALS